MTTILRRTLSIALVLAAGAFLSAVLAAPASASPCGKKVLKDWSDNSRIDGTYELHCYQDAIDALPEDLRAYSDASDVISRAFREAGGRKIQLSREQSQTETKPGDDIAASGSPSSLPIPLLVLGGVALALLAAGGFGYLSRRRRAEE